MLDVGCGKGSKLLKPIRSSLSYAVGVDVYLPRLSEARGFYDDVILADVCHLPVRDGSFDATTSFDVLDHLTPSDVPKAVGQLENAAKRLIVVTIPTPLGERNFYRPLLETSNPLERHPMHHCSILPAG